MYNIGERREPEQNIMIRLKTAVGPSPTHQASTQDPTSDEYRGGGGGFPSLGSALESISIKVKRLISDKFSQLHLIFS